MRMKSIKTTFKIIIYVSNGVVPIAKPRFANETPLIELGSQQAKSKQK